MVLIMCVYFTQIFSQPTTFCCTYTVTYHVHFERLYVVSLLNPSLISLASNYTSRHGYIECTYRHSMSDVDSNDVFNSEYYLYGWYVQYFHQANSMCQHTNSKP